MPATAQRTRTNRYAADCRHCGENVPAETGILSRTVAGRWVVEHQPGTCPTPTPRQTERFAAQRDAQRRLAQPENRTAPEGTHVISTVDSAGNADVTIYRVRPTRSRRLVAYRMDT